MELKDLDRVLKITECLPQSADEWVLVLHQWL